MSADASRISYDTPNALPAGTRLGEFELLSLLGVGGFGIVYLAFDHDLERQVAIKEYMPAVLVGRTQTLHVSLRSQSDAESFALGLRSFVNEAKLLARFDHPSLLKVLRFWEANGTAYMAMPVLRGRTLKEVRHEMTGTPAEAWLRSILLPLLGAMEKLHGEGVFHRDIAPDNIQIEPDGRPVLLDFGAARRVLSDRSQALTAILKPAYAPIEQYGETGAVRQGPWTDIYSLGATFHFLMLGRPPAPATARTLHDEASSLTAARLPGCSESFLRTIDWMLRPRPADRPQSVADLRNVLEGRSKAPSGAAMEPAAQAWERTDVLPGAGSGSVDLRLEDEDATLVTPPRSRQASAADATEHVWIEPDQARPRQPASSAPAADFDPAASDFPPMTAHRGGSLSPAATPAPRARRRSGMVPLLLAAIAAVAVAAAVVFWPQQSAAPGAGAPAAEPVVAPQPPPEAPAQTAPARPSGTPAAAALTAPRVASSPTPAMTSVVAAPAPEPVPAPSVSTTGTPGAALPALQESAGQPVTRVDLPNGPAAERTTPPRKAGTAGRPAPERSRARAQPAQAAAADVPEPATTLGPAPICGSREGIRYHVCMERECGRAEFAGHATCLLWKQNARRE